MTRKPGNAVGAELCALRSKAEATLQQRSGHHSADALIYELEVHKIELEMQNGELRQAQEELLAARDRYVDLYEFAPNGYLTLSETGLIKELNLKAASMLEVERQHLVGRRFAQFVDDSDKHRWHQLFQESREGGGQLQHECGLRLLRKDDSTFHAHLNCVRTDAAGQPFSLRVGLTDVSRLKLAEMELRIAAAVFRAQEGMMVTDAENRIVRVNPAFTRITGYSAEEVVGKNPRLLQSGRHNAKFYATMWSTLNRQGEWSGEVWNKRKSGEIYPEHLTIMAVRDQQGTVTHYVATVTDVTMSRTAADEIQHLAFYDALTGLPNRQLLLDRLKQALASSARSGRGGALLFIDLDDFKTLNDTFGHAAGDQLLGQVAQRLNGCVRSDDTVARLGGDEFVVLLEDLSAQYIEAASQAESISEKILAALNRPYRLDNRDRRCTPSIGATLFRKRGQDMEELLKQADSAMYQAKKEGRNTIRFFDPQMQANMNSRTALEADLHQALVKRQFRLYFQAQSDHRRNLVGAEALVRWQHPKRGLVHPSAFIALAEETGMIAQIGRWVLEAACRQLRQWQGNPQASHLQIGVNISPRQFYLPDFVEQVVAVVRETGINPARLKLELTESLLLDDIEAAVDKMNALREIGVEFSMDDFGTGCSSLAYLTRLPITQIKIDQTFIRNIGIQPSDSVMVEVIIGMARSLHMSVLAEGVETEQQRAFLEQHGCAVCQGYLFGEPMPLEQFEQLLQAA